MNIEDVANKDSTVVSNIILLLAGVKEFVVNRGNT
jgi:hypothetical protein